jgi:choline dehydrogenase-like flavoprotein
VKHEVFDVVVVGSGVAGGAAAQRFCEAGFRVLVLEAGKAMAEPASEAESLAVPPDQQIQARCYAFGNNTHKYFVNGVSEAYHTPSDRPFSWIRIRAAGGKSLLWAGHCYRMTDLEFKAANTDGAGEAWPIPCQEISPYYDKAEHILQVRNARPGLSDVRCSCAAGSIR